MNRKQLIDQIRQKQSYLCVGLDSDSQKLPEAVNNDADPILTFNKAIIDATKDQCVAYKINSAFYEARGETGWLEMQKTVDYIPNEHFKIADVKRSDIGNTAKQYAKAFFDHLGFDAVTLSPYMGKDSITPFLDYKDKWSVLLGLTSNKGSEDFQMDKCGEGSFYETVIRKSAQWGSKNNLMYVVGSTRPDQFRTVRAIIPDHFLLIPGIGAQGGDLNAISEVAMNKDCGMLVNVSRSIIYAGRGADFAEQSANKAIEYNQVMQHYLPS